MTTQVITKHRSHTKVTYLSITGLFAAMICITTAFIFHIPFGVNGGYIHLGDTLIYIAASLLPMPYAMAAAAIGGTLADILTAPMWALATLIIKALLTIMFTSKKNTLVNLHNVSAVFVAGVVSIIGYYLAELVLLGSEAAFITSVTSSLIQAIGSGLLFIVIGATLDKINFKQKFQIAS